ncbi:MAG: DUF2924 domain-containing protein [Myxococcales bacterium]|nr:MAG: DUF2924 domain-containing protein [Myxococcales bacterium]
MPRQKPLVTQHLENLSRDVLDRHQDTIKGYIRNRRGIYALYRKGKLYYVGLASNLSNRLNTHLRDKHCESWDSFSVYLTIHDEHLKELESLILRIMKPSGNKVKGKFFKSENLLRQFTRRLQQRYIEEIGRMISGGAARAQKRKPAKKGVPKISKETGRKPVMAPYVTSAFKIRAKYKGKTYKANVRRDGTISYKGTIYNSPSLAGIAIIGHSVNGWDFWCYERSPGDWVHLDNLRRQK